MTKEIQLDKGLVVIVDDEDFEYLSKFKWHAKGEPGFYTAFNRGLGYLHRVVLGKPGKFHVDHINHNRLDDRKCNLRLVTHAQNQMNTRPRPSKTGERGINVSGKKFSAYIKVSGKRIYLGIFEKLEDAVKARKEAEEKYFGEFAFRGSENESISGNSNKVT